jgi:hypothetical protein
MPVIQKGTTMHIASASALVRRAPAQTDARQPDSQGPDIPGPQGGLAPRPVRDQGPTHADPTRSWAKRFLPGAILLTVLAVLGALLPLLF